MSSILRFVTIISVIIIITSLSIMFLVKIPVKTKQDQGVAHNTQELGIGGDFVLHDTSGNAVDSKYFRGKYMLIYFGFTFCPDICPTSLLVMSEVIKNLGTKAQYLQPVFITVDPKRDSANQLKEYFAYFDPLILPLTGTEKEISDVTAKFKVYYAVSTATKHDVDNYLIDHSSFFYLVGPNGKLIKYYNSQTLPVDMAQDILSYAISNPDYKCSAN